jgi:Tol biopolymer transport system component
MYILNDYSYASHYHWRDPEHLLIHSRKDNSNELYLLKDKTQNFQAVDKNFFLKDGHCSYSPDRNFILYDSYPDELSYRNLYLYDLRKHKGIRLVSLYSDPVSNGDIRCDLHPRWNRTGTAISFDSTHEGHRHIYHMDLKELVHI